MSSWQDDALAVVNHGIEVEREGNAFYTRAAERTADERGKTMFKALAEDELIHLQVLEEERNSLTRTGSWKLVPGVEVARDRAAEAPALFPRNPADVHKAIKPAADDLEALQFGIETEQKSYRFYDDYAKRTADPAAIALFGRLAREEQGHWQLLQDTYDYLTDPEGWYQHQEKPLFEG